MKNTTRLAAIGLALVPVAVVFLLIMQPLETLLALGVVAIVIFVAVDVEGEQETNNNKL